MHFSLPGGRGGHVKQVQEGGQHRLHPSRPAAQEPACHHRPLDVLNSQTRFQDVTNCQIL